MAHALVHRGPDGEGVWVDADRGIGLGHRRLAIIDVSPSGAQPMLSACGRYVLSYNGEIYNFRELRTELERTGRRFRGSSDTEVIVEGISHWGLDACIERLIGMFAFALWDRHQRRLSLVRDRLGIKPLYYTRTGSEFRFGSELKPLLAANGTRPPLDRSALTSFMRHGYVPAPHTIFEGVAKLEPGHLLHAQADLSFHTQDYWSLLTAVRRGRADPLSGNDTDVLDEFEVLLGDAVSRRMIADVPLGAFLSGGIDSSLVVALMQHHSERPVRTFSIGFEEPGYDEAVHAKAVACHLGTAHTELYVQPSDALAVVPMLPDIYDEPFADSSQLPTFLVSQLTRKHVTVSLSGDGGDELFAGYNRYLYCRTLTSRFGSIPRPLRELMAGGIRRLSPATWDSLAGVVPRRLRPPQVGDKAHKVADLLQTSDLGIYRRLVSQWEDPEALVPGGRERRSILWSESLGQELPDWVDRMQYMDTITYLPDDILTKVDRASMAVSLEARVPLLDHRVVEFSWRLPMRFKLRDGRTKWLLRALLDRHVPARLVDRPKMGFGVPIERWLRKELREWAEDLLSSDALANQQILNVKLVRQRWEEHLSGRRNWHYPLWNVLMFQAWHRRWACES